jgi:hypothetical protein
MMTKSSYLLLLFGCIFRLYLDLTSDEWRNILDPKEVYGKGFPGESFRVLKEL